MEYLGLNIRLNKLIEKQAKFKPDESVEQSLSTMKRAVREMLMEEQFPQEIIDVLFIKDKIIDEDMTDDIYLKFLLEDTNFSFLKEVKAMYLDFYSFEHVLRRGFFPPINSRNLTSLIKTPHDTLQSVIFKTNYYKYFQHLNVDNYRKLFDEYLYNYLKPYQYQSIGVEGISARVMRWNLKLENDAIEEKSKRYKVDGLASVRVYHD